MGGRGSKPVDAAGGFDCAPCGKPPCVQCQKCTPGVKRVLKDGTLVFAETLEKGDDNLPTEGEVVRLDEGEGDQDSRAAGEGGAPPPMEGGRRKVRRGSRKTRRRSRKTRRTRKHRKQ